MGEGAKNRQDAIKVCKDVAFALEKLAPATAESLWRAAEILEADGERYAEIHRLLNGEPKIGDSKTQTNGQQNVCACYVTKTKRCGGTKEVDLCNCGGDKSKCDFYPEVREKGKNAKS